MDNSFTPPFCPNSGCLHHHHDRSPDSARPFFRRFGSFLTTLHGRIQRFLCMSCGHTFSSSSFQLTYYTKKPCDLPQVFRSSSAGESLASIARHLGCSPAVIQNRLERLGRASLALHARLSSGLHVSEDLAADGFENFERSQYHPSHLNLLVGTDSQFLYAMTHVTLRRKGRMTELQKKTRARIEQRFRPPPGALVRSFSLLLAQIPKIWDSSHRPLLTLRTDEHPAYPRAIAYVPALRMALHDGSFRHECTPSTLPRTVKNPLFAVNYFDRELRKDIAGFRRETTCVIRNVGAGLLRSACYLAWHNYRKPHRVKGEFKGRKGRCHAEEAGVERQKIEEVWLKFFVDRPFPARDPVPDWAVLIWNRKYPTPLAAKADYVPAFSRISQQQASGF